MSVLNLNNPVAPRLVQILYWIALLLIALGLLRGIVGGVRMMAMPAPVAAVATVAAPANSAAPAATAPAAPGNPPAALPGRRGPGFGFRGRRFHGGPPFSRPGFMMGGPMRGLPLPVLGGLRILGALIGALVLPMVVRVLAEIANAILVMGAKARS